MTLDPLSAVLALHFRIIDKAWEMSEAAGPRHEQSRTSGAPESSAPSSRHSQHDTPTGGVHVDDAEVD